MMQPVKLPDVRYRWVQRDEVPAPETPALFTDLPASNFSTTARAGQYLAARLRHLDHEVFGMLILDEKLRLLADEQICHGRIDTTMIHAGKVLRAVLDAHGAMVILYYKHFSADPAPGHYDVALTRRIADALRLIDVRLCDHIVAGEDEMFSYVASGLLP